MRLISHAVQLPDQLRSMRQPTLQGIPDLVVEVIMGPTLLCLDVIDPGALGRLLAEPIKQQLAVGLGH
jgi:hypothetical protein